ncbi:hypothetical protein [Vogesella fluminis]|uniref:hypothetical protein n=1 Tax=Vogesella fluminis TaxID=1069161 RepID=UPI00167C0845|nr:hypothetical protein [Vogesella fluminis]
MSPLFLLNIWSQHCCAIFRGVGMTESDDGLAMLLAMFDSTDAPAEPVTVDQAMVSAVTVVVVGAVQDTSDGLPGWLVIGGNDWAMV